MAITRLNSLSIPAGTVEPADISNNAITTDKIADIAVTDSKLHTTLDLSSKTLTGDVTFTNNVAASYFSGDGSALTGIEALPGSIFANASATANTLHIAANSNIGINDTTPSYSLDVTSNGVAIRNDAVAFLILDDTATANTSRPMYWVGSEGGSFAIAGANRNADNKSTGSIRRLVIDSNGNVRLGDPLYNITSKLTIRDDSVTEYGDAVNSSGNEWNNGTHSQIIIGAGNNSAMLGVDADINARTYWIQGGHGAQSFAQYLSTFHINPHGGDVLINAEDTTTARVGIGGVTSGSNISGTASILDITNSNLATLMLRNTTPSTGATWEIASINTGTLNFYKGTSNTLELGTNTTTIPNGTSLYAGGRIWHRHLGTLPAGVGTSYYDTVTLNQFQSTTLNQTYQYRINLVTTGTGTDTGATYLVYYKPSTSSWTSRLVSRNGTGSNHPELYVSGTNVRAFNYHGTAYGYIATIEAVNVVEDDSEPHVWGADYGWYRDVNDLIYNEGPVSIGNTDPSTTVRLKVQGTATNTETTAEFFKIGNTSNYKGSIMKMWSRNSGSFASETVTEILLDAMNGFTQVNADDPSNLIDGSYRCYSNAAWGGDSYIVVQPSGGGEMRGISGGSGNWYVQGTLSKGSGSFRIPHPLIEKRGTHRLVHSFAESPGADLFYSGMVTLVDGTATINIDTEAGMTEGTFVTLCREVRRHCTNESGFTAVKSSIVGNILTIEAQDPTCTDEVFWMVVGERQDPTIYESTMTDDDGKVIVEPLIAAEA